MDDALLSVRDVASYLKLNVQTVYRMAREGRLPATKIGKQWRFSGRMIEALIQGSPESGDLQEER